VHKETGSSAPPILAREGGATIAYRHTAGALPGVMFFGGFLSDMTGTKARALEDHCRARGRAFLRFDYSGHGASSGRFEDGAIGEWAADALAVLDKVAEGPQVLVGSSMGAWIMLLVARARRCRVAAMLGIASAPDFTEDLLWARFDPGQRARIESAGAIEVPSDYGDAPYPVTHRLIEDGRRHLVLRQPLDLDCPVRLIHGLADRDVPWETSLRLAQALTSSDVELTLVKNGGHQLSEPPDLERLFGVLEGLLSRVG
jgi:pimeloyl-ACP methyl ester carboxylesterase